MSDYWQLHWFVLLLQKWISDNQCLKMASNLSLPQNTTLVRMLGLCHSQWQYFILSWCFYHKKDGTQRHVVLQLIIAHCNTTLKKVAQHTLALQRQQLHAA